MPQLALALLLGCLSLAPVRALGLQVGPRAVAPLEGPLGFDEYAQLHSRSYSPNSAEYHIRKELFERRVAEVQLHNSQPDRTWTATLNHLSDRTDEELEQLRGYNRNARPTEGHQALQLLGRSSSSRALEDLPASFSWKNLVATNKIVDQQDCGSCWAISTATVIRAHAEIYLKQDRICSAEQIISCTPNPASCGGSGGCGGATTELAMEYVLQNGCQNSSQWPYQGRSQECPLRLKPKRSEVFANLGHVLGDTVQTGDSIGTGSASFGMVGYRKLPENLLAPLLLALYEQGPVAVTVAAGSAWNMYHSGVMNSCHRDTVISHAVTLIGYGESVGRRKKVHQYWLIQNSWGKRWGEQGSMRLQRRSHEEEAKWCGWDRNPGAGSGCKGGPSRVWVCGSCGILYDNVVPIFQQPDPQALTQARWLQERPSSVSRAEGGSRDVR